LGRSALQGRISFRVRRFPRLRVRRTRRPPGVKS
jgi:hypothetical protein